MRRLGATGRSVACEGHRMSLGRGTAAVSQSMALLLDPLAIDFNRFGMLSLFPSRPSPSYRRLVEAPGPSFFLIDNAEIQGR
ncbi:hypothetical protein AVEN_200781-1 [Araneus ventricosus]|uniref:Uncharacterized protein n=1 Tax=Araneus ventricosus TaxID=182803 RepID=A0A4Y2DYK3_ARAVE|nr:hypothetical protein AVEN_200781-1 [Araneus ventricosus]